MDKPSVNVIIITYNQEELIKETLDSVINQTYGNISKVIVADDNSSDKTPEIITNYASKHPLIKPILAKTNKGIAYNVNRALKHVSSDYFCIMGGDDLMYPQKIEKQVNYLDNNLDLIACLHDADVFDSTRCISLGKFSEVMSFKKVKNKIDFKSFFNPSILNFASSGLYRVESIPANGFDTRLKYWNDFLFNVEVLMNGDIGYLDDVLGKYKIHAGNVTSSDDIKKTGLEDALIAYSIIIAKYPELYSLVRKRRTATYITKIFECIRTGDLKRARYLSKVLMFEGSYFKGLSMYFLLNILNGKKLDNLLNNKRLLKCIMRFF